MQHQDFRPLAGFQVTRRNVDGTYVAEPTGAFIRTREDALLLKARKDPTDERAEERVNPLAPMQRGASGGGRGSRWPRVETVSDEHETRLEGMAEALLHRMSPKTKITDNGRQFGSMSLLEIGRELLEAQGFSTRGLARGELVARVLATRSSTAGMQSTSDFASLMANVTNKRLRQAYDENPGTYQLWARRAPDAPDFKAINVVQISAMPDLLKVNEGGEFHYGSLSDGKETYGLMTFGRAVALTRQAMINDDLRAFDRVVAGYGASARRLENRTIYGLLTGNPVLSDGQALFSGAHSNTASGGSSALTFSALSDARKAMRLQRGKQSEELNLAPSYLIVPGALEQTAYQLTSAAYVPATQGAISEFRAGGRTSLEPIVEPVLDGVSATQWYLAAKTSQTDTIEYCYLEGADGPVVDLKPGFDTDGVAMRCRLDFAAAAIDHRGLYRAVGV